MAVSPTLYFVRHGETDWNHARRFQGQTDIPLNETGRAQAARNGQALRARLGENGATLRFIASPLLRAAESMQIVRRQMELPPDDFERDGRLMEISFGEWEGCTWEEMRARNPERYQAFLDNAWENGPPGGESYAIAAKRIAAWLTQIHEDCVIVSHGGISRVLRTLLCRLEPAKILDLSVPQDKIILLQDGQAEFI